MIEPGELLAEKQFVSILRAKIKQIGRNWQAAQRWHIAESHLSDILNFRRRAGPDLLAQIGFERAILYRMVDPDQVKGEGEK